MQDIILVLQTKMTPEDEKRSRDLFAYLSDVVIFIDKKTVKNVRQYLREEHDKKYITIYCEAGNGGFNYLNAHQNIMNPRIITFTQSIKVLGEDFIESAKLLASVIGRDAKLKEYGF